MSALAAERDRWFAEQVQPHGAALRNFLLAHYPALPDVDDIVQDCLVRVLRAYERGPVHMPRALLFATARNLAVDMLRRRRIVSFEPMEETSDSPVFKDESDVAASVCRKQELELLMEAIQSLPTRCRQVLTLRTAYGFTMKQIADELGITESTVEKQMAKAVRRCSDYFAQRGLP